MIRPSNWQPGDLVSARRREWVVLSTPSEDLLKIRPLRGSDEDAIVIDPDLEIIPVKDARFPPPTLDQLDNQESARLLSDAIRLSLRRGAGPFRSSANLGVEPRPYQLVPLMMSLKLDPVRMLIADDVGIGKTIEAGMIVRELLDRGKISSFTVLTPPPIIDQWVNELREKFDIDAVAVTAANARTIERKLSASESLFDALNFTVVSLDYIKSDKRKSEFLRACPSCVLVDEAHTCVGQSQRLVQQRYELLKRLAEDSDRSLILLTATPHSGDDNAFNRLLGLVDSSFKDGIPIKGDRNVRERYYYKLAQHFVQRRRTDIEQEKEWLDINRFPRHLEKDAPFKLSDDELAFQNNVLDYCMNVTNRAGENENKRRLAFWGTLALMRCVGSSPAAALSALRNRQKVIASEANLEPVIFDETDEVLQADDVTPSTVVDENENLTELARLVTQAENLSINFSENIKLQTLIKEIEPLFRKDKTNLIIFCRFIATAKAIFEEISRKYKGSHEVLLVTGEQTPEDRSRRIESSRKSAARIMVATDCISEGINLQSLFDGVVNYDLSWNPTRHQQRIGRVNRFGQNSRCVRSVTLFGENSAIDGAVLNVILDKAKKIHKQTGVFVPLPEDKRSVANALMQAVLIRSKGERAQQTFDFGDESEKIEETWRDAERKAKSFRARYSQGALRPELVIPEWKAIRALNGGPKEVERFVKRSSLRLGQKLANRGNAYQISLNEFPAPLKSKLVDRGFEGSHLIRFEDDPQPGLMYVGRIHPIVSTLAETLGESALSSTSSEINKPLGRSGVWKTNRVSVLTTLLLLRLRFKLISSGREKKLLLVEEVTGLAFSGLSTSYTLHSAEALELLEAKAVEDIDRKARERRFEEAKQRLDNYTNSLTNFAKQRAQTLAKEHQRLTEASRGGTSVEVKPSLPSDVLGLFVLLPEIR